MSCGCENRKRMLDIELMRSLAKKFAAAEGCVCILYRSKDGTFGFVCEDVEFEGEMIEYVYG